MKTIGRFCLKVTTLLCVLLFLTLPANHVFASGNMFPPENGSADNLIEYKGMIVDKKTGDALAFASISVVGTNISSVSNTDGQFSIKLPQTILNARILISFIGYRNKQVLLADLKSSKPRVELEPTSVQLPELSVVSKDAAELIRAMLEKKRDNYSDSLVPMTAFYRETIKKNKSYASLAEAVLAVDKLPYSSSRSDVIHLYKSRKKTDYAKLDTLTFKLMGGPFSCLSLDVMKCPEALFTEDMMTNYEFIFDKSTYIDKQMVYVIDFKQKFDNAEPLYAGKLYIDAQKLALKSAVFSMNLSDKDKAASIFILKKPLNARVYPIEAKYRVDYRERGGKWYFNYSRIELGLKIVWKRKLFNTNYYSTLEMAVTDWGKSAGKKTGDSKDRLKSTVIISDEALGFSDPGFWGEFNVIEPEKSIDTAIKKIQKQLEKK